MTILVFIHFGNNNNMTAIDIPKLKNIFSALANEKRLKIVELCSEKERTITELSKLLKLDYSITVEYTSMLAKVNVIKKTRNENKTVSVKSLIKLNNHGEIRIV